MGSVIKDPYIYFDRFTICRYALCYRLNTNFKLCLPSGKHDKFKQSTVGHQKKYVLLAGAR